MRAEIQTRERKWVSRASSSPGRKEEFPLASDCLTCKNVAFVAGLRSFFWQAVCDQLSPFPPFSLPLFLCRLTCLPSNPVSLDSARLQPLQTNSDWLVRRLWFILSSCPLIPVQVFPIKFSIKLPRWGESSKENLGVHVCGWVRPPHPCVLAPTKVFWPRIFPPPWSRYRFPAWGRSTPEWDRCRERSCCWWRWVCGTGSGGGAGGGPDPGPRGAGRQKAGKGTPGGIRSCRKACRHDAPPEETRP